MNFEIAPKSTQIHATWEEAKIGCFVLNVNGKTGWRLPTIEELEQIYESENDFGNLYFWAADQSTSGGNYVMDFRNGDRAVIDGRFQGGRARAVRDLKDNFKNQ